MNSSLLNVIGTGVIVMALMNVANGDAPGRLDGASMPAYLVAKDVPQALQELVSEGRIAEAEEWLDAELAKEERDPLLVMERERLRRLRRDFSLTQEEMLAKLQRSLPTATAEQLEEWRVEGAIQWIPIDGEARFFGREPGNLFRFHEEARALRDAALGNETKLSDPAAQSSTQFDLDEAFAEALDLAKGNQQHIVLPVRFQIRHTITVNPGAVPKGETIRCWVPFPREMGNQRAGTIISSDPAERRLSKWEAPHRTLYFEKPAGAPDEPTVFQVEYEYSAQTHVTHVGADFPRGSIYTPYDPQDLEEQPPHIVFTPELKALAAEIVGDEADAYLKAKKIFEHMDTIPWAAEMEYSIMPRIVEKIMTEKRGDCGVQALMFISLCRASGIPARWQSGWIVRPGDWNLHDWAEFYVEDYGWLPADPSMGLRKVEREDVRYFPFGNIDAYRMIANVDYGKPFDPPKTHWRSDPVDSQRGEVEWDGGNLYYGVWKYKVDVIAIERQDEAK